MKIILTGSSGFLDKIILSNLKHQSILSLGRNNANIICDLSTQIPKVPSVDLVIHSAGKAHIVPKIETEKQEFFISSYSQVESVVYDRFSLEGWLYNIFVEPESEFWNKLT
jgi:dTDP-4-dehydrorhamnose reductase